MTPIELLTAIAAGKFASAYYFYGTEDYRMVEAEKYVARQFLPDTLLAINYRRFDGRQTKPGELIAQLQVFPMLGERQVFVVTDVQHYKADDLKRILKLIQPNDPSRIVVFSTPSAKKPRKDAAIFKALAAAKIEMVEFKKLTAHESESVITKKLARFKVSIDKDALQALIGAVAGNRGAIETETDKLIDLKGKDGRIQLDDVLQSSSAYGVFQAYELGETVAKGDAAESLRQIRYVLNEGTGPTGVLYYLSQHFLSLYEIKQGKHLEPYRRFLEPKFREQASRFSNERLERIISAMAITDAQMRQDGLKPEFLLELLVLQITSTEKAGYGRTIAGRKQPA